MSVKAQFSGANFDARLYRPTRLKPQIKLRIAESKARLCAVSYAGIVPSAQRANGNHTKGTSPKAVRLHASAALCACAGCLATLAARHQDKVDIPQKTLISANGSKHSSVKIVNISVARVVTK